VPKFVPRPLARLIGQRAYGFFLQTEDGSAAENRVRDAATHGAMPVMDYDDRRVEAARREHRHFVSGLQRALLRAGLVSFTQRIGPSGTAHVCGTLITGNDPLTSDVDACGRVHGLEGLFVVDGSILPRSSRVNPSLTIFAWALRCADMLVRTQGHQGALHPVHGERAAGEPI